MYVFCHVGQATKYAPRVKSRKSAVPQWIAIIQAHQLHEHIGDQHAKILDIARLVQQRHDLYVGVLGPCSFGRRSRHLQDGTLGLVHHGRLFGVRIFLGRLPLRGLDVLCRGDGLRIHPQLGFWRLRDDGGGGGVPPRRSLRCCRSSERGRVDGDLGDVDVDVAGVGLGRGVVGGGQAWRGILGARVDVAPLAALRRRRGRGRKGWHGRGGGEGWPWALGRVEPPCGSGAGHGEAGRGGAGGCRRASRGMVRARVGHVEGSRGRGRR